MVLGLTYTPSLEHAWSSVYYIQDRMTFGARVRDVHRLTGDALLLACAVYAGLFLCRAGTRKNAAAKPPTGQRPAGQRPTGQRPVGQRFPWRGLVLWWALLGIGALVLGMEISGLRLPWDQTSYWALTVEMNLARALPVVGPFIHRVVAGADTLGQLALTRLYAAHVLILPAMAALLLALAKKLTSQPQAAPGVASHEKSATNQGTALGKTAPFGAETLVVLAFIIGAILWSVNGGAPLGAPADPARTFPARPEWFIRPLYKLRELAPPALELVAVFVIPGLLGAILAMFPLVLRRLPAHSRKWALILGATFVALPATLAWASLKDDAENQDLQVALAEDQQRETRAKELAHLGVPPGGPLVMLARDPMTRGRELYEQSCMGCHMYQGRGERKAPDIDGLMSRGWILDMLKDPTHDRFFGKADLDDDMPSQSKLGEANLIPIRDFLYALGQQDAPKFDRTIVDNPIQTQSAELQESKPIHPEVAFADVVPLFEAKCVSCHEWKDEGDFLGMGAPDLTDYGSMAWLRTQVLDPEHIYGDLNKMPAFQETWNEQDLNVLLQFVYLQRYP